MKDNIFIPKKIKVGYQERNDTYSKKLAYVIYYDEKDTLRKEKSWESWRDKKMPADDFDNEPASGFVLNKKAGGDRYSWNPRQTYVRVFDPRGFEIEITVPNLLYILENTNSIKGKGLDGEFVYGWSGTELILIPTTSPDYEEIMNFTDKITSGSFIETKDLNIGYTYLSRQNEEYVYIGEFEAYNENRICVGKRHIFAHEGAYGGTYFDAQKTTKEKFVGVVHETISENFNELLDLLNKRTYFYGNIEGIITNKTDDIWDYYNITELKKLLKESTGTITLTYYKKNYYYHEKSEVSIKARSDDKIQVYSDVYTIKEFIQEYKPIKKRI